MEINRRKLFECKQVILKGKIHSTFWYDVTREMRRLALVGKLTEFFPERAGPIRRALEGGGRIVFSPDEDEFYQEFEVDHIFHDPRTGRAAGVRRL